MTKLGSVQIPLQSIFICGHFFCPFPPYDSWDRRILSLFAHSLSYFRGFPVLTAQPLHLPAFSRHTPCIVPPASPFPTLHLAHSLIGSCNNTCWVPISRRTLSSEDIKMKTVKKTVPALGVLVGSCTSTQCETMDRGVCAGFYCAVLSIVPPLAPSCWQERGQASRAHQAPSAASSLATPSLSPCALPIFDLLAVSQLYSFLSQILSFCTNALCVTMCSPHYPQLLSIWLTWLTPISS